jgi:hypothetical protein
MSLARKVAVAGALLLLALLIGPLGWKSLGRPPEGEKLSFYRPPASALAELIQRARDGEFADELGRLPIEEELARELFGLDHPYNRYDSHAYYTHETDLDALRTFKEHPKGAWRMRTNSVGMRRDSEPSASTPDLRVLVVGDSHVDGICNNSENLCAVAEARLESEHPGATVEVLNCARGGHSLWNYLGVIEKHLSLEPDVVIVTIFGGNDFTDVLLLAHAFEGTKTLGLTPESKERRSEALTKSRYVLGQGYGTLLFFKDRPLELDYSLDVSRRILEEISRTCSDAGAELILMYLPSPLTLPFERAPRGEPAIRALLGFDDGDLALPATIRSRLLSLAMDLEITMLDLTPTLTECKDACFWETDLHLSVTGHDRVGLLLAERMAALPGVTARLDAPEKSPR